MRHRHTGAFGHSDLYIVCRLAPLTREIVIQAAEIEECFWDAGRRLPPLGGTCTTSTAASSRDALANPGLPHSGIVPDAEVFMADGTASASADR